MSTSRYVYNKCLEGIKNGDDINFFKLRNKYVIAKNNKEVKEWETQTPKDVRAGSTKDLVTACKTAFKNLSQGNISKFKMKYRSKKQGYQSIVIPKTAITLKNKYVEIYKSYGLDKIKICKELTKRKKKGKQNLNIEYDCRLQVNNYNQWFLLVPVSAQKTINPNNEKCALDPGSRKFQTIYSPFEARKLVKNNIYLAKLRNKIAHYQQLRSKKYIRRSQMMKKIRKQWKIYKNMLDDLHFQTCNYLTQIYKEIFLPRFESQKMVKKLNPTTSFDILNLQHYKFKERLKNKCLERNCNLNICTEEFTSKTCTNCGVLTNVGSNETFNCKSCKLTIDRDINGARNIYIKCNV